MKVYTDSKNGFEWFELVVPAKRKLENNDDFYLKLIFNYCTIHATYKMFNTIN
jgi:hypothetical protein